MSRTVAARRSRAVPAVAGTAAALGALALANGLAARRAEAAHPPQGHLLEVDGARVHVLDLGPPGDAEPPVVLLHGNLVTAGDWLASGVAHRLAGRRRVLVPDRPGFGHSERPRGRRWGARAQAALLREACRRLGVRRPVVVGHSWGTLVALAWALDAPEAAAGVVLLGGYYFPTARLDAALVAPAALPVLGDALCHTLSPPLTRASLPLTLKGMFDPRPVPAGYRAEVPPGLIARPVQVRATAREGAMMLDEAATLAPRAGALRVPAALMAGAEDHVVDPHAQTVRLASHLRREAGRLAGLAVEPGAGHMVHHAAPGRVVDLITRVAAAGREGARDAA